MKKYAVIVLTAVFLSFLSVQRVNAGEIIYSDIKDNMINIFAELPDSSVNSENLIIDDDTAEISLFSDCPTVNTVFLTDRSAVKNYSHDNYSRIIRNILETGEENDKFSFVSFDDNEIVKDADFTGKQLDILNAAEKLIPADRTMELSQPVSIAENMFENSDEIFCRIILFTKTENLKSFKVSENCKYPLFAVLLDGPDDLFTPAAEESERLKVFFRYCRCSGETDPDSISDFINKNSRICSVRATIPEKLLKADSERTVVLELSSDDADCSFSQKVMIPSFKASNGIEGGNRIITILAISVFVILILGSCAAAFLVKKKKKVTRNSPSNTLNISGTSVIVPKKGKGTLVSAAGTKMLFEETGEYRIVLSGKGENTRNIVLVSSKETIIGRNQYQADEVIYDERSVSQKHCRIYTRENRVFVEDLNSLNHTFVNGEEIKDETEITTGSVLKIGRIEFDVQIIFSR